jgi:imidazolonepropionase
MELTVEEAITALTINGAAALRRADRIGSIEVGKQADFVLLSSDDYNVLPYYVGMNCVSATIKNGEPRLVDEEFQTSDEPSSLNELV